jgi:hypothetical protein
VKACSETKFLKPGDQSAFVTGGRSKPNHNNNVSKPQKKEHKPMLTIRGEVTWQRDAETGEWKIRSAAEDHRALKRPDARKPNAISYHSYNQE